MPRKKTNTAHESEIIEALTNPLSPYIKTFSWSARQYHQPEDDPNFPWKAARILWQKIEAETIAHWQEHSPCRRPWPFWLFTLGLDSRPDASEEIDILKERGLLSPYELQKLAQWQAKKETALVAPERNLNGHATTTPESR